jgi:biopolymer transport protein ExbD
VAGSFASSDDEVIAGINVTPLVDVVLVLLIIFLITAPVLYQSAIKVQLPKAKTGEEAQKSGLSFTITKDGKLSWDKNPVDWEELSQKLARLQTTPEQSAMISADEATPHGTVVKLMDALRTAGITRFALSVEGTSPPAR